MDGELRRALDKLAALNKEIELLAVEAQPKIDSFIQTMQNITAASRLGAQSNMGKAAIRNLIRRRV